MPGLKKGVAVLRTTSLVGPSILDPTWFNRVRRGEHAAVVAEDRSVEVEGVRLQLSDESLYPGTGVRVWLSTSGFFVCATVAEIARDAQERQSAAAAAAERRRQRLNALRAEALALNARINLPAKWDVGIKDVLTGLSEASWCDGRSKATVAHVYLLEALQAGRLTRREGDFLCTSAGGSNGKRWSGKIVERSQDGDGNGYQPMVSCKACLATARRFAKE